jgi:murein DD-endopeptidase MepM/ murein hydrolase activator NlpD
MFSKKEKIIVFLFLLAFGMPVYASIVDTLKNKISTKSTEIKKLEKDIEQYQFQLDEVGKEKNSLQKEIKTIDITRKKLSTSIRITKNKISSISSNIKNLNSKIYTKKKEISKSNEIVKNTIRKINEIDDNSLVELVLSSSNISDFWNEVGNLESFQVSMSKNIKKLGQLKKQMEVNKLNIESERNKFVSYKEKLSDQKEVVDRTKRERDRVLLKTKNKESNYKKLLKEKISLKKAFEDEIMKFESQLRIAIDPSSLPPIGTGALVWPFSKKYMQRCKTYKSTLGNVYCLTQYFGNTKFASRGAYKGKGHNGVDLRASIGTRIGSAASGTVVGVGNTDAIKGCYSYGKWVLVRHNNGLSTLYAHLSLIKVKAGQEVSTGSLIGYSGNSGYSTGPHLHVTVYATQGVKIKKFTRSINCKNAYIPIAPLNAYLNPLDYL